MPNVGPIELFVVLVIALLVLGPKRLPDAGRAVGAGMRNFKRGLTGADEQQVERRRAEVLTPMEAAREETIS
jgi:sec-independent protein translocase protein TatA